MLDIKRIKEDPEKVKAGLRAKEVDCDQEVDRILELDKQRRDIIHDMEQKKAEQNKVSKTIPQLKKAGEDTAPVFQKMGELKSQIAAREETLRGVEAEYRTLMLSLPNLPDDDLKPGGKENNEPLRYFGEPHKFDFEPKHHVDLCTDLGLIDYTRGVKLAGSGFWMYTGLGARLEWALLNYFIDTHLADGYEFILPPHMLEYQCGETAGQFPALVLQHVGRPPASSPSSPMRCTRSRTPPTTASTTCSPPPRPPWPACTGMRSSLRPTCPRSSSPTPPASGGRRAPPGPRSGAWSGAISLIR